MNTTTATRQIQTDTPQLVSLRGQYAHAASSVARFDTEFLVNHVVPRERARNRELHEAGTLRPADLVYLRATLDDLESRGMAHLVAVA